MYVYCTLLGVALEFDSLFCLLELLDTALIAAGCNSCLRFVFLRVEVESSGYSLKSEELLAGFVV